MIPYLLHIAILVTGAYVFYKFFLEKETFFQVNRWVLLIGVMVVVALPFLQIPVEWSLRNQQKVNPKIEAPAPVKQYASENEAFDKQNASQSGKVTQINKETNTEPAEDAESIIAGDNTPTSKNFDVSKILLYVYFIGLGIFGLSFLIQLLTIFYKIYTHPKIKVGELRIVKINKNKAPFSFWNWIFMNPAEYDRDTYRQILRHEEIHILEKHTLDILLAEILVVIQWFNPFAWLYRKAVENNLEYLTDQKMLLKGTDRQAYQLSLLRVAVPDFPLQLTTNYNQSFLKKRISMMNARKSSLSSAWKYLFLMPLLGLSVLCLNAVQSNASEAFYQELPEKVEQSEPETIEMEEPILAEQYEEAEVPEAVEEHENVEEPESILTESEPEDEVEVEYYEFNVSGNWSATIKGNEVCIAFHQGDQKKKYQWYNTECLAKNTFTSLPLGSEGTFELKGDAGTIQFKGKFVNNEGQGTYTFRENSAFRTYLEKEGYTKIKEELLFHCTLSGVDKAYLAEMKKAGFKVDGDNLRMLAHLGPKVADLKKLQQDLTAAGYTDTDLDDLLSLTIHEVDMAYIKELKAIGYPNLSLEKVVQASIHDISPTYFKELKAAGVTDLAFEELLQFAIHDIDAEIIKKFQNMGVDLSKDEMIQFAIHDIEPAMIEEFKNMGFRDLSNEEIIQAAIHDITPEYFAGLKSAGMGDMTMEELLPFAIHDIDAEMIQKFNNMGVELSKEEIIQFAIHDIEPEMIEQFKNLGFRNLSNEEIIQASIHDVDAEFIRSMHDLGFKEADIEDLVQASIHDVDAAYIKAQQAKGKKGLSLEEYIHLKIHSYGNHHHDDER